MRRLQSLWRSLFHRSEVERQITDELSFHIEARAADLMSRHGISRAEAVRLARIEFDRSKVQRRAERAWGCG